MDRLTVLILAGLFELVGAALDGQSRRLVKRYILVFFLNLFGKLVAHPPNVVVFLELR